MNIPACILSAFSFLLIVSNLQADPQLSSWLTQYSGQYARVREQTGSTPVTTWPAPGLTVNQGSVTQALPAYSDIQSVSYSAGSVYVTVTGLASHIMGPWYNNAAKTALFGNWPVNQNTIYKIPRSPSSATQSTAGLGPLGVWANGVVVYNVLDAHYYLNGGDNGMGTGVWNRDARLGEGLTFDSALGHQPGNGQYHYHVSPRALRYQLGDNIDYNSATDTYVEDTSNLHHSPILGWAFDGYPIYGPYGYDDPSPGSTSTVVRRMLSGYQLRDGTNGTDNYSVVGTARSALPAWAVRVQTGTFSAGPNVTATSTTSTPNQYQLGWYIEDYDYLGDHGFVQGQQYGSPAAVLFDLNAYNVRYCRTPEFPGGTYAYFTTIQTDGTPAFPYVLNRQYFGDTTNGGKVTSITETVTTYASGGPNSTLAMQPPGLSYSNGNTTVTLTWSSVEGGTYNLEATGDLTNWPGAGTTVPGATGTITPTLATTAGLFTQSSESFTTGTYPDRFYRVSRTALANYDSTGGGTAVVSEGISTVSPTSASHTTNVTLTITLNSSYTPPPPPAAVAPTAVNLTKTGATTINANSFSRNSTTGVVTAVFNLSTISPAPTLGSYNVNVTFSGPAGTDSYANGFTIN